MERPNHYNCFDCDETSCSSGCEQWRGYARQLEQERGKIAKILNAYPDSDLVSLAEHYAAVHATAEGWEQKCRELEAKLKRIVDLGHNNDCIFCGLKDKEALTRLKGA